MLQIKLAHEYLLRYNKYMRRYDKTIVEQAKLYRSQGFTYSEISKKLNLTIPKGTYNSWFKGLILPPHYYKKVKDLNKNHLAASRFLALEVRKKKRIEYLESIDKINLKTSILINDIQTAKIALSMLCLGEASKYKASRSFSLGNSDPKIIHIFLSLLKRCFDFNIEKVRCTVQCRADQDTEKLESYWQEQTRLPKRLFYKTRIDPRTIGKKTKKKDYMGVLRVNYIDTRVQLELESLSNLVYNQLKQKSGPEV